MRNWFGLIVLLLGTFGCESVDSEEVRTGGIHADIEVLADGSGKSVARAALRVGGSKSNTYLDLSDGDRLVAYRGDESKTMNRSEGVFGDIHYATAFGTDAESTLFRIAFLREHKEGSECGDVSAPSSTATLPAPFTIEAPAAETEFSRSSDDVALEWDPSDTSDPMTVEFNGDCIHGGSVDVDGDPGRVTIDHSEFERIEDEEEDVPERCPVTITVERTRSGMLDPAYGEGGSIRGIQRRRIEIVSTP